MALITAVIPYKKLDRFILADGTEIPIEGHIASVRHYEGSPQAEVCISINVVNLQAILKSKKEIDEELKGMGIK